MKINHDGLFIWQVECPDGTHDIAVQRTQNGSVGYKLYVDNKLFKKLTPTRKGIIMSLEYTFEWGGERLTLVVYGAKVDLVYRGQMQNTKIQYEPENVMPVSYRAALIFLNLLSCLFYIGVDFTSQTILFRLLGSVIMLLSSSGVIILNSTTPFFTKKKKIVYSLLILILSILVVAFYAFLPVLFGSTFENL